MLEFDFRNIIVFVSLMIQCVLLMVLVRHGKKTVGGRAYAFAVLAVAFWILPMLLFRSHLFGATMLWVRLLYIMASFTSTTFFYFSYVFPDNRRCPASLKWFICLENLIVVLLCIHPSLIIQGVEYRTVGEDTILWGPLYPLYVSHISSFFLASFILLYSKYRHAAERERKQIVIVLAGLFTASNLAMVTNLILPWFGYFELNWLGQFFSSIFAITTTYAILRYNLLNIKLIATEGFLLVLNIFLLTQFAFSNTMTMWLVNTVVLIAVIVVSYILIRSAHKEQEQKEELSKLASTLEHSNLRLQELDRQKNEFLSIAAHQLRTPLSIINGYLGLIHDGAYGKVTQKLQAPLKDMDESNGRLVKLVDEFLDITRIEQNRTKYDFKNCDMIDLIQGAVKELKERADEKKLRIMWHKPVKPVVITGDAEKLRHVVFNFIDNAIKYSDKGTIRVLLREEEDDGISVRVRDHGLGFTKKDEVNFFQKFYRGENVRGINVNGTGLGLYVCGKFIEAHDGKVWAKSTGLGKGSEFGFWVPRTQTVEATEKNRLSELALGERVGK